jgi:hypothetical protein
MALFPRLKEKTLLPARKISRSSLSNLALILADQAWRSSGFFMVPSKCRITASLYSLKNCSHSATEGVLGGQAAHRPYSPAAEFAFHAHPLGDDDFLGVNPFVVGVALFIEYRIQGLPFFRD